MVTGVPASHYCPGQCVVRAQKIIVKKEKNLLIYKLGSYKGEADITLRLYCHELTMNNSTRWSRNMW